MPWLFIPPTMGDMLGAHRLFSKNAAIYEEVVNIPPIIKGGKGKGSYSTGISY